jgi:major membrane immunogen (membrane-anchored lipoprotein)
MKNKKIVVIGLLLLSMTLAACSTAASTEPAIDFPTGKFVKSNDQNHGVIFNNDGTFAVFDGSMTIANGTYRVEEDTYIETSNDEACPVPMSFGYTFDGTNLTFNYVGNPADDPCGGRRADFNNVTYILSKE